MAPHSKRPRSGCAGRCGGGFRAAFVRLAVLYLLTYQFEIGISLRTGNARNGGAVFVAFVGGNEMTGFRLMKLTCGASQLYWEMNSVVSIVL